MAVPKVTRSEGDVGSLKEREETSRGFDLGNKENEASTIESQEETKETGDTLVEESSGAREGESESAVEPTNGISDMADALAPVMPKDPLTQKLEHVLEEDLKEVYLSMSPEKQKAFRKKGEEVTGKIRLMIETAKFSVKKALGLIRDWLKMIPGVNKFFLEQEAKIKTDKISDIVKGG